MMWVLVVGYPVALALVLAFIAGAAVISERWDHENERMIRLRDLYRDAA